MRKKRRKRKDFISLYNWESIFQVISWWLEDTDVTFSTLSGNLPFSPTAPWPCFAHVSPIPTCKRSLAIWFMGLYIISQKYHIYSYGLISFTPFNFSVNTLSRYRFKISLINTLINLFYLLNLFFGEILSTNILDKSNYKIYIWNTFIRILIDEI